jgi:hypothetical protein
MGVHVYYSASNEEEYLVSQLNIQKKMTVAITGEENGFILIADTERQFATKVHKSLIQDNELEITNNEIVISKIMYETWFKTEVENRVKNIVSNRKNLLLDNLALLLAHKDEIINNQKWHNIFVSGRFYYHQFSKHAESVITIGELLEIWTNEPSYVKKCECGGTYYLYTFAGSVLSGSVMFSHAKCASCGKELSGKFSDFGDLRKAREKYHPLPEPIIYDINAFEELINSLKTLT